jgi:hypothetical protein
MPHANQNEEWTSPQYAPSLLEALNLDILPPASPIAHQPQLHPQWGPVPPTIFEQNSILKHQLQAAAHNNVEKRYRNNLNRSIATLRDSVPSIRRNPNQKMHLPVNKATIIDEAVKYIKTLEQCEKGLKNENSLMNGQLLTYQTMAGPTLQVDDNLSAEPGTEESVSPQKRFCGR